MNASTVFLLLLVLACPVMMMWMMRGGYGHGGHSRGDQNHDVEDGRSPLMGEHSTRGLHELRDEIDRLIEEREATEGDPSEREPAIGARR